MRVLRGLLVARRPLLERSREARAWDCGGVGAPCGIAMAAGRWRLYYTGEHLVAAGATDLIWHCISPLYPGQSTSGLWCCWGSERARQGGFGGSSRGGVGGWGVRPGALPVV